MAKAKAKEVKQESKQNDFETVKNNHNGPWIVDGVLIMPNDTAEIDTSTIQAKTSIAKGFLEVC